MDIARAVLYAGPNSNVGQSVLGLNTPVVDSPVGACDPPQAKVSFESPEHQILGDALTLQYDGGITKRGYEFEYSLGRANVLSFGQIVSLADFYSNWTVPDPCKRQISDPGLTLNERLTSFNTIVGLVLDAANNPTTLTCLMNILTIQSTDVGAAEDPAQCFNERNSAIPNGWDAQYAKCTLAYPMTALCNWDHFGQDAITAYGVGHTSALNSALAAQDNWDLKDAYLKEAFAQHFLSDLFSAGHIRAPRRVLHSGGLASLYPGDRCNKYMHDEDSANGIWVKNTLGQAWPMYGDKQLLSSKSYKNKDQAINAMQSGANELFQVYKTRKMINPTDYAALKMIPIMPVTGAQNFNPMFSVSSDGQSLNMRSNLDDRSNYNTRSYNISQLGHVAQNWQPIENAVQGAGVVTNMYPRTIQDFTAELNISHIRQINSTHLVLNRYGPQWTRLYDWFPNQTLQRSWSMLSQSIGPLGVNNAAIEWKAVVQPTQNTFTLFGDSGSTSFQIGMQEDGSSNLKNAYVRSYPRSPPCTATSYVTGNFSTNSDKLATIEYCGSSASSNGIWVYTTPSLAPSPFGNWTALPASNRHALVLKPLNQPSVYVESNDVTSNLSTTWTFTRWTDSYSKRITTTYNEPSTFPAFTYLVDQTTTAQQRVIRMCYDDKGSSYKVDVLAISVAEPMVQPFQIQDFAFNLTTCASTEWFLMDVNGNGMNDLVGYCPTIKSTIAVIVHLALANGSFADPDVTYIASDYALNFNGPYLKHIVTVPTLFDNYGILGARLLSPLPYVTPTYKPVGQYPAIAGQLSGALNGKIGFLFD